MASMRGIEGSGMVDVQMLTYQPPDNIAPLCSSVSRSSSSAFSAASRPHVSRVRDFSGAAKSRGGDSFGGYRDADDDFSKSDDEDDEDEGDKQEDSVGEERTAWQAGVTQEGNFVRGGVFDDNLARGERSRQQSPH